MDAPAHLIHAIDDTTLDAFGAYLVDHLKDNGRDGTPLFQPQSHAGTATGTAAVSEKIGLIRAGLAIPVGERGWRRGWVALHPGRAIIIGHVDLRAHLEPCTAHRALLGMGTHRDHRRRGLGRALVNFAVSWAIADTALEWIDLAYLAGNAAAERLYRSVGFHALTTVPDMFRVDGRSVDNSLMALRLRS